MKKAIHSTSQFSGAKFRCSLTLIGLIIPGLFTFSAQPVHAEVAEAWVQRYSNIVSNSVDRAFKVLSDAAGDIIVTGITDNRINGTDVLTIKYSGRDGSIIWQRRYNGAGNAQDKVNGLALDTNGNVTILAVSPFGRMLDDGSETREGEFYIARYAAASGTILWETRRAGTRFWYDEFLPGVLALTAAGDVVVGLPSWGAENGACLIAKYAGKDGALLWTERHSTPEAGLNIPAAIAIDGLSNVVIAGQFENNISYTAKFSVDGRKLWESSGKALPAGYSRSPKAVALDHNGNVVVTAEIYNGSNSDIETTKANSNDGTILWTKLFDGISKVRDAPSAVAVDGNGDVIVSGFANRRPTSSSDDFYTAKYAGTNGAVLWEKLRRCTDRGDYSQALTVDQSGNAIITATMNYDYYTAKYAAADGVLIWDKSYQGVGTTDSGDYAQSVAVDPSGDLVVIGNSDNSYHTIKYDKATGARSWQRYHRGPANGEDRAMGVVIDANRNVIVTGISSFAYGVSLYPFEYHTAKYSAMDGAVIWSHRHAGSDRPGNVAVDGSGDVIVTGSSYTNQNAAYAYTAKLRSSDGTLLWERRHSAPGNGSEINAVAVDAENNVVITGSLNQPSVRSNADYYTAKYAAADGALLWQRSYTGSAGWDDRALALAIDFAGNVLVTGHSTSGERLRSPVFDFYTAKYAATNGAILWERRYNGPSNGDDQPTAIALDATGNVFVTGRSSRSYSSATWFLYDAYTAKYASHDGAVLWEKTDTLSTNTYGEGMGLVVDAAGDLVFTGYFNGFLTVKYSGTDGAVQWSRRGPGGVPRAVRITSGGNAVIAGDGPSGYYAASYALADGALLWERNYHASTRIDEYVSGLAVGPGGTIALTGASNGDFVSFDRVFDYATVLYREGLAPLSMERLNDGFRFRFTGIFGRSYALERAKSLSGPWNRIHTAIAPASGIVEHLENIPLTENAFYRTTGL